MFLIDEYQYGPPNQNKLPLWLDAEKALIVQTGNRVSDWLDPRGGYGARQATNLTRPLINTKTLGGRPTLEFQGSQTLAIDSGMFGLSNGPNTSYIVCAIDTGAQCTPFHGQSNIGGSYRYRAIYTGGDNMNGQNGPGGPANVTFLNAGINSGRIHLIELRRLGSDFSIAIDGNTFITTNIGVAANFTMVDFMLGSQGGSGNWLTGRISEVLCYNDALSISERNGVLDYIENKYTGLTLTPF